MNPNPCAVAALLATVLLLPLRAAATDECLRCHTDAGHVTTFQDGETRSVDVDPRPLAKSPHKKLDCVDCHEGYEPKEHHGRTYADEGALRAEVAKACGGECHEPEGIHGRMLEGLDGQLCMDCHGGHDVKRIDDKVGCIGCHQHALKKKLGDGTLIPLKVDPDELVRSVHETLDCVECHDGFGKEHPITEYADARALTAAKADSCKGCHFDKYTRTLEGIHFEQTMKGDPNAPTCVDCHGAHGTAAGSEEKLLSARRCQRCHEEVYETYAQSVHGAALVDGESLDVPVCADCHRAHDIADPRTVDFANRSPETCGRCHADATLMARYGLSTNVLESYLDDFHGVTASMYAKEGTNQRRIAVCTDCHGIHDIATTRGESGQLVKAKLVERCQKCHPDAKEGFPDAWLSHYEPTWKRASLVWAVDAGYRILIPFMLVGLLLQILLHVWRYTVHR